MLPTRFLFHPDTAKAGTELLDNIQVLTWCGYFQDAFELSTLLLNPGPWKTRADGDVQGVMTEVLPWLAWLLNRDCPAVASNPPRGAKALERYVQDRARCADFFLQPDTAGVHDVTAAVLATLPAPGFEGMVSLTQVVSAELSRRIGAASASSPVPLDPSLPPLPSADLYAAVLRAMKVVVAKLYLPMLIASLRRIGVLAMLEGGCALAAQRLAPHLSQLSASLHAMLPIPHMRELMQSRELALAAGMDAERVARYRAEVSKRSPQTLLPRQQLNWKSQLKRWVQLQMEAGDIDFPTLRDQAGISLPPSTELAQLAKRRKLLASAAPEEELHSLELRIGQTLPPSYRNFLMASNGLLRPDGVHLLPCGAVGWMHEIDPETVETWCRGAEEASDAQYTAYGSDQDCVHMRPRHLRRALMISQTQDGDYWLLIPEVRFGAEWEAWFLGAKNPGAYRYRSFGELFEEQGFSDTE